jgi:hypothetical protein
MKQLDIKLPPPWWQNPLIVFGVVVPEAMAFIVGLAMIFIGSLEVGIVGALISGVALLAFFAGQEDLGKDAKGVITGGVVKIWGHYPKLPMVYGKVPLFPWFPLFVQTDKVALQLKSEELKLEKILSKDRVSMSGKFSYTYQPDIEDGTDYIGAGGDSEIPGHIDDIALNAIRTISKNHNWQDIHLNMVDYEGPILQEVATKLFGVCILKGQVVLSAPDELLNTLNEAVITAERIPIEEAERKVELVDYATIRKAAIQMWKELKKHAQPDERVPSLDECMAHIERQKLINQGKVARIEGGGGNINLAQVDLDLGGNKAKKGGKP